MNSTSLSSFWTACLLCILHRDIYLRLALTDRAGVLLRERERIGLQALPIGYASPYELIGL